MLKISKNYFFQNQKNTVKDNSEYFKNIPFIELKISK